MALAGQVQLSAGGVARIRHDRCALVEAQLRKLQPADEDLARQWLLFLDVIDQPGDLGVEAMDWDALAVALGEALWVSFLVSTRAPPVFEGTHQG